MEPHNSLAPESATNARDRRVATGALPFGQQFRTGYQVTEPSGGPDGAPLVILHGGPGIANNYTKPMADPADSGRAVIHYAHTSRLEMPEEGNRIVGEFPDESQEAR
jgi:hypothetical protein